MAERLHTLMSVVSFKPKSSLWAEAWAEINVWGIICSLYSAYPSSKHFVYIGYFWHLSVKVIGGHSVHFWFLTFLYFENGWSGANRTKICASYVKYLVHISGEYFCHLNIKVILRLFVTFPIFNKLVSWKCLVVEQKRPKFGPQRYPLNV